MLLPPSELALAEAYLRDDFDIRGDIESATALADVIGTQLRSPARLARIARMLRKRPTDDSPAPAILDENG
jgi:cyclopropane-fatty-acyl-phospholipid synthase